MMYEVLLHQYKISPSINSYLRVQKTVNIDPFKRFHEIASPDSIEAMCNIFEMYRSMVFMLGDGISEPHVHGFSDTIQLTSGVQEYTYRSSMNAQESWRSGLEEEKKRISDRLQESKRAERAAGGEVGMEESNAIPDSEFECLLPSPVGWPIVLEDGSIT